MSSVEDICKFLDLQGHTTEMCDVTMVIQCVSMSEIEKRVRKSLQGMVNGKRNERELTRWGTVSILQMCTFYCLWTTKAPFPLGQAGSKPV